MRMGVILLLLPALAGCDQLTGVADQKIADAEAIGFACRVSLKSPEDCMKENDTFSPSHILDGWKNADADIKAGKLDPAMRGEKPAVMPEEAAKRTAEPANTTEEPAKSTDATEPSKAPTTGTTPGAAMPQPSTATAGQ